MNLPAAVFLIGDLPENSYSMALQNSALGGDNPQSISTNSALLSKLQNNYAEITYVSLLENVYLTNIAYYSAKDFWQGIKFGVNIAYLNYGDFDNLENEKAVSTFSANDFSFGLLSSGSISDKFNLGIEIKYFSSSIEDYSSSAIVINPALEYKTPFRDLNLAFTINNFGFQLSKYANVSEDLPLSFSAGFSKKLEKAPLILYGSYFYYPDEDDYYSVGAEMTLKSRIKIRAGYDFSSQDKEIGTNNEGEKFGGLALGAGIDFIFFDFNFAYRINGELAENMAFTLSKSF